MFKIVLIGNLRDSPKVTLVLESQTFCPVSLRNNLISKVNQQLVWNMLLDPS